MSIGNRRVLPEKSGVIPGQDAKFVGDERWDVACAIETEQIIDAALADGGGEALGVADNPGGQVAAVGTASDSHAPGIHKAHRQERIDPGHQIFVGDIAPGSMERFLKRLTVASGASRIAVKDDVATGGMKLPFVPHGAFAWPPHDMRPAMDVESQWIGFAGLITHRQDIPALEFDSRRRLETQFDGWLN